MSEMVKKNSNILIQVDNYLFDTYDCHVDVFENTRHELRNVKD